MIESAYRESLEVDVFLLFSFSEPHELLYAGLSAKQMIADLRTGHVAMGSFLEGHGFFSWKEELRELLELGQGKVEKVLTFSSVRGSHAFSFVFSVGMLLGRKVIEMYGIKHDDVIRQSSAETAIREKLEAEFLLDISEQKLASIIEVAVDGIVIINEKGTIQGFNRSAEVMFGYRSDEVMGKNVSILMPEPHNKMHDQYIRRYLETGIPHIVGIGRQVEARRKDSSLFPIDLAVGEVRLDSGSLFTGFIRDLSESRKLESERKSFFEMSLDLFCILESDGSFRRTNSQWFELLGYSTEDLVDIKIFDLVRAEASSKKIELFEDILAVRNIYGRVMRIRRRDGEFRWILWNSAPDSSNQVVYGVARDITEQRQILEELQKAKQEAERSSHAKSFFIAKMSHELKTPLNSIMGFSRHLTKNQSGNFEEKDILFLERIYKNGEALLRLINSLLDFAKLEAGIVQVDLQLVSLRELVQEVVDLMDIRPDESCSQVRLNLPLDCRTITTDPVKIRQILQNLIDNAIKFSSGKPVDITLAVDSENNPTRVDVSDKGPGITKEQMEVIFDEFQQGDNRVALQYGGAGLGLAIASSFCDLLGFKISVDSEPGRGSIFSVVFDGKGEGR